MDFRVIEGVALVLVGLLALGLYIGLALNLLTPYEPLRSSILPENPTYLALVYNVTARLYPYNETGWALLLVRFNETSSTVSQGTLYYLTYVARVGGSPQIASSLESLSYGPSAVPEGGQPYVAYGQELTELPHAVIYLSGSPQPAAVLAQNVSGGAGLVGEEVAYYSLSTGILLRASVAYSYANGTPFSEVNYTLYNVTVLQYRYGQLMIVRTSLIYGSLGVLAAVAGAGLVAGLGRVLSAAP